MHVKPTSVEALLHLCPLVLQAAADAATLGAMRVVHGCVLQVGLQGC